MPRKLKLKDLIPDSKNANKGTVRGHELVKESLKSYGAGRSVLVDRNGRLICGNKTASNAQAAGLDEDVIVVPTDGTKLVVVQRTDLDLNDPKARQLAIADNRTSEISLDWDPAVLAEFDAADLKPFFSESELATITFVEPDKQPKSTSHEIDVDGMQMSCKCPKCGFEFDPKNPKK